MKAQIVKGVGFIESFASNRTHLKDYAADFLFFFVHIAATTNDPKLRSLALSKGKRLALEWRKMQRIPRKSTELIHTLIAEQAAHDLGCIDIAFQKRLHKTLSIELIIDVLGFDPSKQPPPQDLTDECSNCGFQNLPSRTFCKNCRKKLVKLSKYDVWLNAIVVTHHLKTHQLLGEYLFKETLKWLVYMRPYPAESVSLQGEAWEAAYAITHVIYGLTDYSLRPLKLAGLEAEFQYLVKSYKQAKDCYDLDLLGECIDALRSFEESKISAQVENGIEFLLANQNEDGSWGDVNHPPHNRMHTTWTVIDAIRGYSWKNPAVTLEDFQ